jgi:hypothetical protein
MLRILHGIHKRGLPGNKPVNPGGKKMIDWQTLTKIKNRPDPHRQSLAVLVDRRYGTLGRWATVVKGSTPTKCALG